MMVYPHYYSSATSFIINGLSLLILLFDLTNTVVVAASCGKATNVGYISRSEFNHCVGVSDSSRHLVFNRLPVQESNKLCSRSVGFTHPSILKATATNSIEKNAYRRDYQTLNSRVNTRLIRSDSIRSIVAGLRGGVVRKSSSKVSQLFVLIICMCNYYFLLDDLKFIFRAH